MEPKILEATLQSRSAPLDAPGATAAGGQRPPARTHRDPIRCSFPRSEAASKARPLCAPRAAESLGASAAGARRALGAGGSKMCEAPRSIFWSRKVARGASLRPLTRREWEAPRFYFKASLGPCRPRCLALRICKVHHDSAWYLCSQVATGQTMKKLLTRKLTAAPPRPHPPSSPLSRGWPASRVHAT